MSTEYTEHIDEVMEQLPNNPAIVPADNRTPQSSNITLEAWNRVQARLVALETLVAKLGKGGFATAVREDVSALGSNLNTGVSDAVEQANAYTDDAVGAETERATAAENDKVSKTTDPNRLYGTDASGNPEAYVVSSDPSTAEVPKYVQGALRVSKTEAPLDAANKSYVDQAGFLKNIGLYNNLVPTASQSVSEVIIDGVTYYTLGGLSDVKAGYAYYVAAVNNVDYWDTFVCLQVVNGTALFWPFRTISGSVPNNVTARKHVFVIDENGKNDTIKYSVDPHAGTGYRSIMQRDANGRSQVNDPSANLDVANKQWTLAQISSLGTVFNVKGTVATVSALPASGNNVGDVYFVTADNSEYVWTSSNTWEQFGPTIDINGAIDSRLNNYYDIFGNGQQLILGTGRKTIIPNLYKSYTSASDNNPYVSSTDYASSREAGLASANSAYGVGVDTSANGLLYINQAIPTIIKAGANQYLPIVSENQHQSVFYGLSKAAGVDLTSATDETAPDGTNTGVYPARSKVAIQNLLGILKSTPVTTEISRWLGYGDNAWDYYDGVFIEPSALGVFVYVEVYRGTRDYEEIWEPIGATIVPLVGGNLFGSQHLAKIMLTMPDGSDSELDTLQFSYDTDLMGMWSISIPDLGSNFSDYDMSIRITTVSMGRE